MEIDRAIKKAASSKCKFKVCAIGIDSMGRVLGYLRNEPRFKRKGGSIHAEMALMRRFGPRINTIIICRTNKNGTSVLPIHPCKVCKSKAKELGIKIVSITNDNY